MSDLLDPLLDARFKGFPPTSGPLRRSRIGAQGWNVLAGDLPLPLAVIRRTELRHNLGWMQRHVRAAGIDLAPHGKTSMSPQLFQRQIEAGAWGITFANVGQLVIGVGAGVRRALIANQVVDRSDVRHLVALLRANPDLRAPFLVDSVEQLKLIESARPPMRLEVLLELGLPGGRTGCRDADEALELARLIHASAATRLVGLECYEGLWCRGDGAADTQLVRELMERVHALAWRCDDDGLFETDEIILSAGGSALFDLVSSMLLPRRNPMPRRPMRGLLRSGCYISHDHGFYQRLVNMAQRRLGCNDGLVPAMEVWATVQSIPEPGLAILSVGKRDISHDMGLPIPVAQCARRGLVARPVPSHWQISALNDQHAYLRLGEEPHALRVGDHIGLGVSHPCTTFDKWRWIPVVDEGYNVVDALTTCF